MKEVGTREFQPFNLFESLLEDGDSKETTAMGQNMV